ncbi:hypothetical protein C8Q74DRAFT_220270 [Fomes fomentarius]|nr:hypothetical protein C8Q74DRAFT_220270 [Fomes fomentarius]
MKSVLRCVGRQRELMSHPFYALLTWQNIYQPRLPPPTIQVCRMYSHWPTPELSCETSLSLELVCLGETGQSQYHVLVTSRVSH